MRQLFSIALAAALCVSFAACDKTEQSVEQPVSPPAREAESAASEAMPSVLDNADVLITDWVLKPSIEADDIEPFVNDTAYRAMYMYGNEAYAQSRGDYFWRVSRIKQGDAYGIIDYSGEILLDTAYPGQRAPYNVGYLREEFRGIEFGLAQNAETGELQAALLVQANPNESMATEFYVLDEGYSPVAEKVGEQPQMPSMFLWLEDAGALGYDFSNEGVLLPAEVNWDIPMPVRKAVPYTGESDYALYQMDSLLLGYATGGGVQVKFEYTIAQQVWEGIAAVRDGSGWYYITMDGKRLNRQPFDAAGESAGTYDPEHYAYNDEYVYDFTEGLAAVCRDGKWGYIDRQGNEVVPCVYDATRPVYNGMAWVQMMGKWGVADLSAYTAAAGESLPTGPAVDAPEELAGDEAGSVAETFALFYTSYIDAINAQDTSLLAYCTDACRADMAARVSDSNNSVQTYEIIEIAVDMDSLTESGVYTRTTTHAYNRRTGAYLDMLETVRYVEFTTAEDGTWLIDSVAVDTNYKMGGNLQIFP